MKQRRGCGGPSFPGNASSLLPRRALFAVSALWLPAASAAGTTQSGAEMEEAGRLIAETAARYRQMRRAIWIRALVHRRAEFGGRWQETRREWELLQGPDGLLARGWDRSAFLPRSGQPAVLYLRRGAEVLFYLPPANQFARLPADAPESQDIQAALGSIQTALLGRFEHLDTAPHMVTGLRDATLEVGGERLSCRQIRIRSARPGESWEGEIWIGRDSRLVRRAAQRKHEGAQYTEETVDFLEIRSGAAAPLGELDWRPPAGAMRMERPPTGPLLH